MRQATDSYTKYNSLDGEKNHVHVEIPYDHKDGDFGHMTRIAEHGVERIIRDQGWIMHPGTWQDTARFIYNWGQGPIVEMREGKVTYDGRKEEDDID